MQVVFIMLMWIKKIMIYYDAISPFMHLFFRIVLFWVNFACVAGVDWLVGNLTFPPTV